MNIMVITIDGPAGAGKTTISRKLADLLGYRYVDTGALYRGVACAAEGQHIDLENEKTLHAFLASLHLDLVREDGGNLKLLANGKDITAEIRTPAMSMAASFVAKLPSVRAFLLDVQRRLGVEKAVVFEGRDMGTVVFPKADIKFFLTADAMVRARRRHAEFPDGSSQSLEDVLADMQNRDEQDVNRDLSPLVPASDALHIDTSALSLEAVLEKMMIHIRKKDSRSCG